MRNLLSGRRSYALAGLVVVGGLLTAAASCEPTKTPVKPPPAPTGLSIEPTSHDFGPLDIGLESPIGDQASFTVTNNGPDTSGTLAVEFQGVDPANFGKDDGCAGKQLDAGQTCPILVGFAPSLPAGDKAADLVVSSDNPADGTATATLSGTATVP